MRALGQVTTSATAKAALESTTYTEQTTNAQRSLSSSSANDAAAGTGARTVRITYYSWDGTTMLGPYSEVVTLNGVTAVPTVNTNICFVEKLEVLTAGSGGVAAGAISINTTAGGGTPFGSIAAGATQTAWAHHYVASRASARLTDLLVNGGNATAATFEVDKLTYPSLVEESVTGPAAGVTVATGNGVQFQFPDVPRVYGPARLRLYVTPANGTSQTSSGSFGFIDDRAVL